MRLATIIALCASSPALAADWPLGFEWNPRAAAPDHARGERLEVEGRSSFETRVSFEGRDGVERATLRCEWKYTRHVLAVQKGRITSERVDVERWSCVDRGGIPDESLAGKKISVSGRGRRTVRVPGLPENQWTPAAAEWIAEALAPEKDPVFEAIEPTAAVRAGGSWAVDPIKLAMAWRLYKLGGIDPRGSTVQAKLSATRLDGDVHAGRVEADARLAIARLPGREESLAEPGRLTASFSLEGPLEPAFDRPLTMGVEGRVNVVALDAVPGGGLRRMTLEVELGGRSTAIRRAAPPAKGKRRR